MKFRYAKLLTCAFLSVLIGGSLLGYAGFCPKKSEFMSEQESIDGAVRYVLAKYPPTLPSAAAREGNLSAQVRAPLGVIHYEGTEDFLRANPNCCRISESVEDGMRPDLIEKVLGRAHAIVELKYSVRFIDSAGVESFRTKREYVFVSSCGRALSSL